MWPPNVPKPSEQLEALMRGRVAWNNAPPAIQSWARVFFYDAAKQIVAAPSKDARRKMLGKIPPNVRPQVEVEVKRLWASR